MVQNGIDVIQPARAAAAVRDALGRLDGRADTLAIRGQLALLAAGRFEHVRNRIRAHRLSPELPLLAARYTAWTGDLHTIAAAWAVIRTSAEALIRDDNGTDGTALRTMTWAELQRTATDIGDPAFAAVLHRRASTDSPDASQAPTLPGDGREPDDDASADTILDFVHRTLGTEPDATRHRLRFRPVIDAATGTIEAGNIRFGDGAVRLRGELSQTVNGWRSSWRAVQDAGAIPLTVLLEPLVHGAVTATAVDGRPAQLAPRPHAGGTIVPVQLVLDDERRLDIEVAD